MSYGNGYSSPGAAGAAAPAQLLYTTSPVCSSDAASSGVVNYEAIPLLWWKQPDPGPAYAPAAQVPLIGKVQLFASRGGVSNPRATLVDLAFVAFQDSNGSLDTAITVKGDPISSGGDIISAVTVELHQDGVYRALIAKILRGTIADIAEDYANLVGPYAPLPIVVACHWIVSPEFPAGVDHGFGVPPGWPATRAEFFDGTGGNFAFSPLTTWRLPSVVGDATYEENATLSVSTFLDITSNAMPWYYDNVRIRIATSPADVEVASATGTRLTSHLASIELTPAIVAALGGYNAEMRIYVGGQDASTLEEWHEDFLVANVVEPSGP